MMEVVNQDIQFETDRLLIRTLKESDVTQDYPDWLNDPEINAYLDLDGGQTIESCRSYVRGFIGFDKAMLVGIFDQSSGVHIGNMTLSAIDWRNKYAWIGIALGRKQFQGKGLAKEALSAYIDFCFKKLKLHAVRAGVSVRNEPSLRLFKNCGFTTEGVFRESGYKNGKFEDSYVLSVLSREFK